MTTKPLPCYYRGRGFIYQPALSRREKNLLSNDLEVCYMYNIKSLCEKSNISQQTFYRLLRENKDFRELVENNKEKKGNGYRYTDAVLSWLLDYKGIELLPEEPSTPAEMPPETILTDERESALLNQINALEAEIDGLKAIIDEKEQERKSLLLQNANLLLLLTQEKQEKQALLPAPRQSFSQRIKALFSNKNNRERL